MEVRVQKCQNCESQNLKNILFRESGEPDRVFVQCHDCNEFVASYVISTMGYYHNGKGFESFLRGVNRSGGFMSGRNIKKLFSERKELEAQAFNDVLNQLHLKLEKEKEKERKKDGDSQTKL